jgi:hypothetical protein
MDSKQYLNGLSAFHSRDLDVCFTGLTFWKVSDVKGIRSHHSIGGVTLICLIVFESLKENLLAQWKQNKKVFV